jgi:hypothetical protein
MCGTRPSRRPIEGSRQVVDPTCKNYSRAALLQPFRAAKTKNSNARENPLVQVQLHNECCEELVTRVNRIKLNLSLNFQQSVSHTDDLRYAGIKNGDLEKNILEHECKEKHSVLHNGYPF